MGRCDGCIHQALSSTQHPSGRTGVVFKFTTNISHLPNRAPCVPRRSSSMRVGEAVDKSFANSKEKGRRRRHLGGCPTSDQLAASSALPICRAAPPTTTHVAMELLSIDLSTGSEPSPLYDPSSLPPCDARKRTKCLRKATLTT